MPYVPRFQSVDDVAAFVASAPGRTEDATAVPNWAMVAGWFGRLPDNEARWRDIVTVATATDDSRTLARLAAYAFEAIVDRSGDSLATHLDRVADIEQFRVMLEGIMPNRSAQPTVEQLLARWQSEG
jgi:hypothetical protein